MGALASVGEDHCGLAGITEYDRAGAIRGH